MSNLNPMNRSLPVRQQQQFPTFPLMGDHFLKDLFNLGFPTLEEPDGTFVPSIDVAESDTEFRIDCELPGMEQKDVDVNLNGNILTISGEKRSSCEKRDKGMYRSECRYGSFSRSLTLPEGLDTDQANASFNNGVLSVKFPKTEEFRKRVRNIPIGESAAPKPTGSADSGTTTNASV